MGLETFEVTFGEVEARRPSDEQKTKQGEKPESEEGGFKPVAGTPSEKVDSGYVYQMQRTYERWHRRFVSSSSTPAKSSLQFQKGP